MLIEQIKQRMFQAMKSGATVEKEVLRTAIGEVTRTGDVASDERVLAVLRKLVKANQETLRAATDAEQRRVLEQEIVVLEGFLPRALSAAELTELLGPVASEIRAAAGPGPAQGIAMKFLKSKGTSADGAEVRDAVTRLRDGA
ncbi:MAG TPA: GatB/YqeY domain-containing protein [Polyangiaceae bacterium]|nr:GatB/YqeY domain-containing protein [Polyangiaceae bacterium]